MLNEDRAEYLGCFGDRESGSVLLGIVTAPVIEHHGGKRAVAGRLPQESFEPKSAAGDLNGLRSYRRRGQA